MKGTPPLPSLPPIQRILILDDDEIMREVLEAMLSPEGFEVTLAQGGEDALRLLKSGAAFDVVLSDLQMPGLQGRHLATALRGSVGDGTALLGMSAAEPSEEVREAFDFVLLKPFSVQLLRDGIRAARTGRDAISPKVIATESARPGQGEVLDEKIFSSLLGMIPAAQLGQLFTMALKDIEKRHARIVEAGQVGDLATAQREAHAIKGSCGMIGATELQVLAAAIEGGTSLDVGAVEAIPEACHRLQRVLESKL